MKNLDRRKENSKYKIQNSKFKIQINFPLNIYTLCVCVLQKNSIYFSHWKMFFFFIRLIWIEFELVWFGLWNVSDKTNLHTHRHTNIFPLINLVWQHSFVCLSIFFIPGWLPEKNIKIFDQLVTIKCHKFLKWKNSIL